MSIGRRAILAGDAFNGKAATTLLQNAAQPLEIVSIEPITAAQGGGRAESNQLIFSSTHLGFALPESAQGGRSPSVRCEPIHSSNSGHPCRQRRSHFLRRREHTASTDVWAYRHVSCQDIAAELGKKSRTSLRKRGDEVLVSGPFLNSNGELQSVVSHLGHEKATPKNPSRVELGPVLCQRERTAIEPASVPAVTAQGKASAV